MTDVTTKGREEAERLRPQRIKNYAAKKAADFTCQHEDCSQGWSLLVVRVGNELTVRCQKHLLGEITPGQWNAR